MKQGKFIVFEGLDGSGKTTQLERLGARLPEKLGMPPTGWSILQRTCCRDWRPAKRCCAIGTIFPTSPTRPLPLI